MKAPKIKETFFSEKGMRIVNVLFLFSMFIRNRGIIFIAYSAWIVYLALGIKNTQSKPLKVTYALFIIFAATMMAVNLCALLNYL